MNEWYSTLMRPPLTPPNWIFGPVWTVLYVTIAASIFLYYKVRPGSHVAVTSAVLVIHLISNFIWSYLFFTLRSPAMALVDILVLDTTLILLIIWFWKESAPAGAILIPYMAWVLFATYLNFGFYRLN